MLDYLSQTPAHLGAREQVQRASMSKDGGQRISILELEAPPLSDRR